MRVLLLSLIFCSTLSACSDQPSEADGKAALQARIAGLTRNVPFEVSSFSKSDGQEIGTNGIKAYRLFFNASVIYPEGFKPQCTSNTPDVAHYFANFGCAVEFGGPSGGNPVRPQPKGASANYSGVVTFEKTERRWIVRGVSLTMESRAIAAGGDQSNGNAADENEIKRTDWDNSGGIRVVFEAPAITSWMKASSATMYWDERLASAGVRSYMLRWRKPNFIVLCVQHNLDLTGIEQAVLEIDSGANNLVVTETMSFTNGACE